MKYCENGHNARIALVEHRVREAPEQGAAKLPEDSRVHLWGAADSLYAGIETSQELLSESCSLTFVPGIGVGNVLLGLRGRYYPNGHCGYGLGV